jgi:hypothetical protein
MSNGPDPADRASGSLPIRNQLPLVLMADPPEEASSDNPMAQAQTILEESEERMEEGAKGSEPSERLDPPQNPGV